jgi:hypothetical protein
MTFHHLCLKCLTDFLDQLLDLTRSVETQDTARQRREPCLVARKIAALARAVIVVRRPFDEFLCVLVERAAGPNRIGAEAPSLARASAASGSESGRTKISPNRAAE